MTSNGNVWLTSCQKLSLNRSAPNSAANAATIIPERGRKIRRLTLTNFPSKTLHDTRRNI